MTSARARKTKNAVATTFSVMGKSEAQTSEVSTGELSQDDAKP